MQNIILKQQACFDTFSCFPDLQVVYELFNDTSRHIQLEL